MDDLVKSIKQNGVLTPVLVRPDKNSSYEMISGHRRMHAAIKAGLETIPAIVRDMDDDDAVVVMVDVLECMDKNTTKVRNIKQYLLAALFNAPSTIGSYYKAAVNHDMPQYAN